MERLHLGQGSRYSSLEASIHTCRYLLAKPFVKGKRVLDVACGEGYGSHLLKQWGADSVVGVDISVDAIEIATQSFKTEGVTFQVENVNLPLKLGRKKFDLIVSLETIEHVDDVEFFLNNIKNNLVKGGNVIISCPNDYWYYKDGGGNPFHKRRYSFEEFKALSTKILGEPSYWSVGTFAIGYGVIPETIVDATLVSSDQISMLEGQEIDAAHFVPMQSETAVEEHDCAFYVGVWGPVAAPSIVYCGYPVSMDVAAKIPFNVAKKANESIISTLEARSEQVENGSTEWSNKLNMPSRAEDIATIRDLSFQIKGLQNQNDILEAVLVVKQARIQDLEARCEKISSYYRSARSKLKKCAKVVWPYLPLRVRVTIKKIIGR